MRPVRVALLALLLLVPVTAGCLSDIRQQRTHMLFYLDTGAGPDNPGYVPALGEFLVLEIVLTHVTFKPNTTAAEPVSLAIGKRVDLVAIRDAGPQKVLDAEISYYTYDEVAIGVNVTNALLRDGSPVEVETPPNNIYKTGHKPFKTRLAGDVVYTFVLAVKKQVDTGVYILQSSPGESNARSG